MSSTPEIPSWARDRAEQVYDKWDGEYLVDLGKCSFALQDEFARALAETRANALEEAAQVAYLAIGDGPVATVKAIEIQSAIRALKNKNPEAEERG